jgi:hypothetical protein
MCSDFCQQLFVDILPFGIRILLYCLNSSACMANFCHILNETCLTTCRRILQKKGIMTEEQIRKDLEDSLSRDQMAAVTVRLSMPRAVWCDVLRGMLHYKISQPSSYVSNLIRNDAEKREALPPPSPRTPTGQIIVEPPPGG